MDPAKRRRLAAKGYELTDAEDFLGLSDAERKAVDLRVALIRALRARRERLGLTQRGLATRLRSSQSRVAKMEAGADDVSLDQLFRGFFELGGRVEELAEKPRAGIASKTAMKAADYADDAGRRDGSGKGREEGVKPTKSAKAKVEKA